MGTLDNYNNYASRYRLNEKLKKAAFEGDAEEVQKAIDAGADVDHQNDMGECALIKAAEQNHRHIVRLLLKNGADVNIKDVYGYTALHMAAVTSKLDVLQDLLEFGADPYLTNNDGQLFLDFSDFTARGIIAGWERLDKLKQDDASIAKLTHTWENMPDEVREHLDLTPFVTEAHAQKLKSLKVRHRKSSPHP